MSTFPQELNTTGEGNRTSAVYDSNITQWLMHTGNCVRTPGGLWVFQKGDANGNAVAVGAAADDAAASGNPLLMAGKYNATPPTRHEGDAVTLQADAQGNLLAKLTGSNFEQVPGSAVPNKAIQLGASDGINLQSVKAASPTGGSVQAGAIAAVGHVTNPSGGYFEPLYRAGNIGDTIIDNFGCTGIMANNGAQWDRWRNNIEITLLANAARTASAISPFQTNYNAKGVHVGLQVTAASGTGGLIVGIWGRVAQENIYGEKALLLSANITTTGNFVFQVYPGLDKVNPPGTYTKVENGALPRTWYVEVSHGDGSSYTYGLGACIIL